MRRQVHAVVIVRRRGDRLIQTLEAVRGQSRTPDTISVIDLTGDPSSEEVFREQLGRDHTVTISPGRPGVGWSEALNLARQSLPEAGWVWVLRDDTTPASSCLQALSAAVDGAPSVVIAGPKQKMTGESGWLREFGETITQWGQRQAIVDRELDQGQYDRMSDVLAVGDAGILISLSVFDELGGADTGLDPLDAPLDLGVRARLAGHRVLAVPQAVVAVENGPADWKAGRPVGQAGMYRLDRHAWLYRRFSYAAWWALIPLVLFALPNALGRSAWHFATKRPDFAVAEVIATVTALLALPQAIVAKARLSQASTVGWSAVRPLRMTPTERRRRRQLASEEKFANQEEFARSAPRPAFWPAGIWLIMGLSAYGALLAGPLLGAPVIVGGGLLPLAPTFGELWSEVRWLQPATVQSVWGEQLVPADPGALAIALLGSVTWWNPSLAIAGLWVVAPLLSGLVAWWAGSQFLTKQLPTTLFAIIWVIQPSFLGALADGRIHGVIVHIGLPWLLATALTAHTSWQRAAQGGFATALVTASAPVLWPVVVMGWLIVTLTTGWKEPLRAFVGTLPLALLPALVWFGPRFMAPGDIALLEGVGRWFADPGVAQASTPVAWWQGLVGWAHPPTPPGILPDGIDWALFTAALGLPALAVAAGIFLTARLGQMVSAGVLISSGVLLHAIAPEIAQGYRGIEPIGLWQGSGALLIGLGVAVAVASTLDDIVPQRWVFGPGATAKRVIGGALATLVLGGSTLAISGEITRAWSNQATVAVAVEPRTLPALVAAEATSHPAQYTLVIDETDGSYSVSLEQGSGETLERQSTVYRLRPANPSVQAAELAPLVAGLVQPSSADPLAELQQRGIRFILLRTAPDSEAALAMGQRPYLIPSGQSDQGVLWKVDGANQVSPALLSPSPSQSAWDTLWLVTWLLWAVLALPTERSGRRVHTDGDDEDTLSKVLEEEADE